MMLNVQKKIANAGSDSILFAHRAALLLEDKQVEQALRLCEQGLKRFPFYAEGHHVLARCYQALNRQDEARAEYERALFYMPNHIQAQKGLAYLHFKNKRHNTGNEILLTNALYDPLNKELIKYLKSEGLDSLLETDGSALIAESLPAETAPAGDEPVQEETSSAEEVKSAGEELSLPQERATAVDESLFAEAASQEKEVVQEEDIFPLSEDEPPVLPAEPQETLPEKPAILDEEELIEMPIANADSPDAGLERRSLINEIEAEENEEEKPASTIDLSQFDNTQDDFSTLMNGIFEATSDEEIAEAQPQEEAAVAEEEPEEAAEERPVLDTSVIFNANRQTGEDEAEVERETASVPPIEDALNLIEEEGQRIEEDILTSPEPEEKSPAQEVVVDEDSSTVPSAAERTTVASLDDNSVDIEEILENPKMLTSTFGEILIAQKKFKDARKVFRELYRRDPQNFHLKKKIDFLDKIIAFQK